VTQQGERPVACIPIVAAQNGYRRRRFGGARRRRRPRGLRRRGRHCRREQRGGLSVPAPCRWDVVCCDRHVSHASAALMTSSGNPRTVAQLASRLRTPRGAAWWTTMMTTATGIIHVATARTPFPGSSSAISAHHPRFGRQRDPLGLPTTPAGWRLRRTGSPLTPLARLHCSSLCGARAPCQLIGESQ